MNYPNLSAPGLPGNKPLLTNAAGLTSPNIGIASPPPVTPAPGIASAGGIASEATTMRAPGMLSSAGRFGRAALTSPLANGIAATSMISGAIDGVMDRHVQQQRTDAPGMSALKPKAPTAVAGAPVARPSIFRRDDYGQYFPDNAYTSDGGRTITVPGITPPMDEALFARVSQEATPEDAMQRPHDVRPNGGLVPGALAAPGMSGTAQQVSMTSAPGVVRIDQAPSLKSPFYTNLPDNPMGGMNTKLGLNGQVGNVSTIGIDKAAIERGIAAERDLHNARLEAMDGRPVSDKPHGVSIGGGELPWWAGQFAIGRSLQQQQTAREQMASQQAIAQAGNNSAMQRLLTEQGLHAPGIQFDNMNKALALQNQQQLAQLHQQYLALNDKNDPGGTQRRNLASQLLTMQGKATPGIGDKFKVVEIGGGIDPSTMQVLPKNAYLLNQETGLSQPFGQQKAQSSAPYQDGTELIGRDGKKYVVQNGQPVLKG